MNRIPRWAVLAAPVLLVFLIGRQSSGDGAKEELAKRFMNNAEWYGQVVVSIHGEGSSHTDYSTRSFSVRREAEVRFRVKARDNGAMSEADQDRMLALSKGHVSEKDLEAMKKSFQAMRDQKLWMTKTDKREAEDLDDVNLIVRERRDSAGEEACGDRFPYHDFELAEGSDTRRDESTDILTIQLDRETFQLRLNDMVDKLKVTRTSGHSGGDPSEAPPANSGKPKTAVEAATLLPSRMGKERKLPGQGSALSGMETIPRQELPFGSEGYGTVEGMISWVVSPEPFEDVELVLKPEDYEKWRPTPGADEKTAGNSIKVQAVLQKRGGGGTSKVKMKSLVVRLSDVSHEPGICVNWPDKGAQYTADLMFEASKNSGAGVTVDGEGTRVRKKDGEFTDLTVEVSAFDGGAWGEVVAEASLTDGRTVFAILDGHPEEREVRLPKRAKDSKIADVWKTDTNQGGKNDEADDDAEPKGDGQAGDGLANYEEYRGFRAKQTWTGGDPEKKDFFVRDESGGLAESGIRLFTTISELEVHRLEAGELSDRVLNYNHWQGAHIVDQHGIRIVNAPSFQDFCAAVNPKGGMGTPRDFSFVGLGKVPTNAVDIVTNGVVTHSTYDAPTVAHELLHCCNVYHHGEEPAATRNGIMWTRLKDGIYEGGNKITVVDSKGNNIEGVVSFQSSWWRDWKLVSWYSWRGSASGDVNCVMRYDVATAYTPQGAPNERVLLLRGEEQVGGQLCTTGKASGTNDNPGRFGPCAAGRGNCKGQILVNDAKTAPVR